MIRILDGPAGGAVLALRRAPLFLRVTLGPGGDVDALDQLGDRPVLAESVHVYRRVARPTSVHIDYTRKRSAWYLAAEYRLHDRQPDDATARDAEAWRAWAVAQHLRGKSEQAPVLPTPTPEP